jgi:predicted DNA-binding transcriptional regulator YafY
VPELAARCGAPITIATSAPRLRAHVPRRLRPLAEACCSRTRVTLIYGDGQSQPVPLAVLPRLLYELGDKRYLEAECVASGMLKTYRLDRVHYVRV